MPELRCLRTCDEGGREKEDCSSKKCGDENKTKSTTVPNCKYKKVQDREDCLEVPEARDYEKFVPIYAYEEYCVNENKCKKMLRFVGLLCQELIL